MWSRRLRGPTSMMLVATLATLAPGASALAADTSERRSLCDALDHAALHALSALEYAEPGLGTAETCDLVTSPAQVGPHSIAIVHAEIPLGQTFEELMRSAMTRRSRISEVSVAGQPGYLDGSSLMVGLDDRFLSISSEIADSAEAGDLDAAEYAIDIAEIVVPVLLGSDGEVNGTGMLLPPELSELSWEVVRDLSGEQLASRSDDAQAGLWAQLIALGDTSFDQLHVHEAAAADAESGERIGSWSAWRVEGVDAATLLPAILDWLRASIDADDLALAEATLGGKTVTLMTYGEAQQTFVYAGDETVVAITLPEELATSVLEQLP